MSISFKIRFAKKSDIKRLLYVTNISYQTPFVFGGIVTKPHQSDTFEEEFSNKEFYIFVATLNDKIIGVGRFKFTDKRTVYLFQLAVLKTYRGQGISSAIIKRIEQYAREHGCTRATLDCMREKRLPEYYMKLGYDVDDVKSVKDYHMVYMSKKI